MTAMPDSENLLHLMKVPDTKIYVVGCFGSRLTFSSQQCRAFNLVWALLETEQLQAGNRLAVVGAGLAGITVAAAASIKGVQVTVFEQANQSMAIQRGNFVRYIHPNILEWPEPGSNRTGTDWDILNWEAATLDNVVAQIDQGWANFETAVTMHFRYRVDAIDESTTQIKATPLEPELSPIEKEFDAIVIAVGFGVERTLENIPMRSYWLNDSLHQESTADRRRPPVLVTGCGDGGLIDVLRLRFKNFDHARFVKDVLDNEDLQAVRNGLLEIEHKARSLPTQNEASAYLLNAYRELPFPESGFERFNSILRLDTEVVLNGTQNNPVTIQSSILHRYIVFLLWSKNLLTYRQGRVINVSGDHRGYSVTLENPDGTDVISLFDEVIVRHGPAPVVQKLISQSAVQHLCDVWRAEKTDHTLRQHWPMGYFRATPSQSSQRDPETAAKTLLNKALAALRTVNIMSIRVGMVGDQIGFVVMPRTLEFEDKWPKTVFGFPIEYRIEDSLPRPKDVRSPSMLRPGALVYCDGSREKPASTIGCFVLNKQGEAGFLSTSHGFVPRLEPAIGAKVYQARDWTVRDSTDSVAEVRAFIAPTPSRPDSDPETALLNALDVAICVLLPDVPYKTTFAEEFALPPLVGTARPRRGDRVFKVGGRSGLTYGTIASISAIAVVVEYGNPLWLQNIFTIEPEGSNMFSQSGDSGSLIVRDSPGGGLVLGMLIGSDKRHLSYALPLQPALEALACSIILENTFDRKWERLCR